MQLLRPTRNSPGALTPGDARTSDSDSPRRAGPLYGPVRQLVNRSLEFVQDPRCGDTKFVALILVADTQARQLR
jgi:hypothetical protein